MSFRRGETKEEKTGTDPHGDHVEYAAGVYSVNGTRAVFGIREWTTGWTMAGCGVNVTIMYRSAVLP